MLRIVVIGCGSIATGVHLPALAILREEEQLTIAGVVDIDSKRAELVARKFGVESWGTMWQDVVEKTRAAAVSVCLPPGPNADVAVEALGDGLHVLCEKPPGRNLGDAERMALAAATRPELVTMVGFNRRFAPLYVKAMSLANRLGKPQLFCGRFTRASLGSTPSDTATDWITSDASHALDLAIATIGFPHAIGVSRAVAGAGPDNVWTIQLHAAHGTGSLVFDFAAGRRVERFEISGPGYDTVLQLPNWGDWAQQGTDPQEWSAAEETKTENLVTNYGYLGEYRSFLAAIRGESPPPACDFGYAASYMHLVQEILACRTGTTVSLVRPNPTGRTSPVAPHANSPAGIRSTLVRGRPVVRVWQGPEAQRQYFSQGQLSELSSVCDLRMSADGEPLDKDLAEIDVLVLGWNSPALTAALVEQARSLKLVIVIGASVKSVHPDTLLGRGILLCSTSEAIAQSVAEYCLLGALAGLRAITEVDRQMRAGQWPPGTAASFKLRKFLRRWKHLPGVSAIRPVVGPLLNRVSPPARRTSSASAVPWSDLRGQTVGLIGWGHVARHFARLLKPFACSLLVNTEAAGLDELLEHGARSASIGEIMGAARVISLHKGMTATTSGLLGAKELSLIRPGAILINTARGAIIEEEALLARLQKGDIVAVLDVFDQEPLPAQHPLRRLDNVILTPHNSSTTNECRRRVGTQALGFVLDWIDQRPVPSITRAYLDRMT